MEKNIQFEFLPITHNSAKIIIPKRFRDNIWASKIGDIQRSIENVLSTNSLIEFNFTECRWVDPLPLLSMLMEMANAKKIGHEVQAIFPQGDKGSKQSENSWTYQSSPNRFLLFLAKEGVFKEILEHNISAKIGNKALDHDAIKNCEFLPALPSYADSKFIPVKLFEIPILSDNSNTANVEFSAKTVDSLLLNVEIILRTRCPAPERRHLLYNLRAVLQEFFHNVQEHAYSGISKPALAALYVRYRQGGSDIASNQEKTFYDNCIKEEKLNCTRIGSEWLDGKHGCIEVFFLDRGLGIVNHFNNSQRKKPIKLNTVMTNTFFEGKSAKPNRQTEHGGLHLLHKLMSRSTDYVRVLDDNTWFGSAVPFNRKNSKITEQIRVEGEQYALETGNGLIGLAYHLRLSWNASTENSETWRKFTSEELEQLKFELHKPAKDCRDFFNWYQQYSVLDERFSIHYEDFKSSKYLLWLPKPNLMKWDILRKLEYLSKEVDNTCFLVVADIPSKEAAMYKAAISKVKFDPRDQWAEKFTNIVFVTNRWGFARAEHFKESSGFHGFTTFNTENISKNFNPGIGKLFGDMSFRTVVVHWLKWHDSVRLWKEVEKSNKLFLNERVIWNEDDDHNPTEIIDGYLDFPTTIHNFLCAALYRNGLGRLFGLYDESKIELIPVDNLADPIIHDVCTYEIYNPRAHDSEENNEIAVGSVLVSGSTLKALGTDFLNIHFFVHSSFKYQNQSDTDTLYPALFHWMPSQPMLNSEPTQKRIGKTSAIAPSGWLSLEIPRYNEKGTDSIGKRNPADTYLDWQNPGPVLLN